MCDSIKALLSAVCLIGTAMPLPAQQGAQLDPAAWGSDHVGEPVPRFTSGDECLFCHRMDVGSTWSTNRHGQTVRAADQQADSLQALAACQFASV
jgi:hypothetical protein